jgi:hypothetical protein
MRRQDGVCVCVCVCVCVQVTADVCVFVCVCFVCSTPLHPAATSSRLPRFIPADSHFGCTQQNFYLGLQGTDRITMLKMSVLNVPAVQRSFLLMPFSVGQYQRIEDSSADLRDDPRWSVACNG